MYLHITNDKAWDLKTVGIIPECITIVTNATANSNTLEHPLLQIICYPSRNQIGRSSQGAVTDIVFICVSTDLDIIVGIAGDKIQSRQ